MAGLSEGFSCQYKISNSLFTNNTAGQYGGAIAWTTTKPHIIESDFSFNSAPYGNDISSFPISLYLNISHSRLLSTAILPDLAPGQVTKLTLEAGLLDNGHLVTNDDSSIAELVADGPTKLTISGQIKVVAVKRVYIFTGFTVLGKPGSQASIKLSSSAIPSNLQGDPDPHQPSLQLLVTLRTCVPGESISADSCLVCTAGTYSFDPTGPCQNCPQHATCLGRMGVLPESGYWRPELLKATIIECPRMTSCLGGTLGRMAVRATKGTELLGTKALSVNPAISVIRELGKTSVHPVLLWI